MAMGCTGVWTQRGVSITGRRSTRYRRISKAAPPEPKIIAARRVSFPPKGHRLNRWKYAQPDRIVCVVDASNLERNLYLVHQILDLGRPVIVVLNMMDLAVKAGLNIRVARLERELGAGVEPSLDEPAEECRRGSPVETVVVVKDAYPHRQSLTASLKTHA